MEENASEKENGEGPGKRRKSHPTGRQAGLLVTERKQGRLADSVLDLHEVTRGFIEASGVSFSQSRPWARVLWLPGAGCLSKPAARGPWLGSPGNRGLWADRAEIPQV